jgi:hypothetical protein
MRPRITRLPTGIGPVLLAAAVSAVPLLSSCSSTVESRDPTGERFPSVRGNSLSNEPYQLPEDLKGEAVVLLVGYVMESQFDIDRWILGLVQAAVDVRIYEVPTIPGLVPGMFSGSIDSGMRSGIPREDWGSVITVYGDGGKVVSFTGNESPRNARVLLLDPEGKVAFFHDRGYSAGSLLKLAEAVKAAKAPPAAPN